MAAEISQLAKIGWSDHLKMNARVSKLSEATREEVEEALREVDPTDKNAVFFLQLFIQSRVLRRHDAQNAYAKLGYRSDVASAKNKFSEKPPGRFRISADSGLDKILEKWTLLSTKVISPYLMDPTLKPSDYFLKEVEAAVALHTAAVDSTANCPDLNTKLLLQALAGQYYGVDCEKISELLEISPKELNRLVEDINSETLRGADFRIHLRNGILIIGPTDKEADLIIPRTQENSHGFLRQPEILAALKATRTAALLAITEEEGTGSTSQILRTELKTAQNSLAKLQVSLAALQKTKAELTREGKGKDTTIDSLKTKLASATEKAETLSATTAELRSQSLELRRKSVDDKYGTQELNGEITRLKARLREAIGETEKLRAIRDAAAIEANGSGKQLIRKDDDISSEDMYANPEDPETEPQSCVQIVKQNINIFKKARKGVQADFEIACLLAEYGDDEESISKADIADELDLSATTINNMISSILPEILAKIGLKIVENIITDEDNKKTKEYCIKPKTP